mgnify:CR=1 FL=1
MFPFHQGRFQGFTCLSSVALFSECFHSTKEGFKGCIPPRRNVLGQRFPFHQGRFQGHINLLRLAGLDKFPFHQGRFQGSQHYGDSDVIDVVSIPPRKVSRPGERAQALPEGLVSIPPRKVSRRTRLRSIPSGQDVSIPPRKVSRDATSDSASLRTCGFHSTKEGFKGCTPPPGTRRSHVSIPPRKVSRHHPTKLPCRSYPVVSIPPRKVSRKDAPWAPHKFDVSFHSTKEGFKVPSYKESLQALYRFHSTKEGFKGSYGRGRVRIPRLVSIPPRKVSRTDGANIGDGATNFVSIPPRKVSRKQQQRRAGRGGAVSIPPRKVSRMNAEVIRPSPRTLFPFHQGRFQGPALQEPMQLPRVFPFHQGRFQGRRCRVWGTGLSCFHSTKEGFKADQQRRHPCLFSIAHRCPRSPCRVKRLRAPASKRLCSSPKRASTPRPFRAIGGRRTAYKNILQKYRLLAILSG